MRLVPTAIFPLLLGASTGAFAAEPLELRLGVIAPEGTAYGRACGEPFAAEVRRASKGRIRIKLFMGATLGDERTMIAQARDGRLSQIPGVTLASLVSVVPELAAFDLPFLFRDADDVDAVLRSPARAAVRTLLEGAGLHLLGMPEAGWRNFAGKKPLVHPADFEGLRARSQESSLKMWRLLGARPQSLPITEVLAALESGAVQAFDMQAHFLFAASLHRQISHYTVSRHVFQGGAIAVSRAALAGEPPATLRLLVTAWTQIEPACVAAIRQEEKSVLAELPRAGVTLVELSPEEREAMARRLAPLREQFRKETTPAGRALLGTIEKVLAKRRAAH